MPQSYLSLPYRIKHRVLSFLNLSWAARAFSGNPGKLSTPFSALISHVVLEIAEDSISPVSLNWFAYYVRPVYASGIKKVRTYNCTLNIVSSWGRIVFNSMLGASDAFLFSD